MSSFYHVGFKVLCFLTIFLICWINLPSLIIDSGASYRDVHSTTTSSLSTAPDAYTGSTSTPLLTATATASEPLDEYTVTRHDSSVTRQGSTVTRQYSSVIPQRSTVTRQGSTVSRQGSTVSHTRNTSQQRRPHESSKWTTINLSSNLFVYGANAFYDRRTSVDSDQHNVRMVLVTKSRHLLAFNKVNVTCTLSSENKMVLQTLASMWIGWQRPLKVDGVFYKSLTMSCPVNASASIDAVELTLQSSNFTKTRSLPVMYPDYPSQLQHSNDALDIKHDSGVTSYIVNENRHVKYHYD